MLAIRLLLCCCALSLPLLAADYDEAYHDDGSLHYKIKLNRDGQRDGTYVIYHPGGDKKKGAKAEIGSYRDGQLHGVVTRLAADGTVLGEAQWRAGECFLPMTERFLKQALAGIERHAAETVAALPAGEPGRIDDAVLVAVLARMNHYRLLCGLSHDVGYDAAYIHQAQCAAEVCQGMKRLDHHPKSNPGLADDRWQAGKAGCGKSNLAMGRTGPGSMDAWMDDSDESNRDRVGHRRWLLWPELDRIGFGQAGSFAASYVIGDKRADVASVPVAAFPPKGLMPLAMFAASYCWSASPDKALYEVGKGAAMVIRPYDYKSGAVGAALELDYRNVNLDGFGNRPAIIARPKGLQLRAGAMYQVELTGVSKKQDGAPDLRWVTVFY